MEQSADILPTVLKLLSGIGELRQRRMFGGMYIYCNDMFIATIHDNTLYFKANSNTAPEFIELGLPAFSYLKQGSIATLQYYQAPEEVFHSRSVMHCWASKALAAARQDASAKKPRKSLRGI